MLAGMIVALEFARSVLGEARLIQIVGILGNLLRTDFQHNDAGDIRTAVQLIRIFRMESQL
jgi:hypothetical protein